MADASAQAKPPTGRAPGAAAAGAAGAGGGGGMERSFSVDDLVGGIFRQAAAAGMGRTDSESAFQEFLKRIPSATNLAAAHAAHQAHQQMQQQAQAQHQHVQALAQQAAGAGGGAGAGGEEAEARVVKVRRDGCVVFVPKYGIEGPVEVDAQDDDLAKGKGKGNNQAAAAGEAAAAAAPPGGCPPRWRFDEARQRVEDARQAGGRAAGLFERVRVRISARESAGRRRRLVLELVGVGGDGE